MKGLSALRMNCMGAGNKLATLQGRLDLYQMIFSDHYLLHSSQIEPWLWTRGGWQPLNCVKPSGWKAMFLIKDLIQSVIAINRAQIQESASHEMHVFAAIRSSATSEDMHQPVVTR
jgi:hypothetical protein